MTPRPPTALLCTDLDGTLLDAGTYRYDEARSALERALQAGVALVLCSSKTLAELVAWQARLGVSGPLISENGGGCFLTGGGLLVDAFPDRWGGLPARIFGVAYERLRAALVEARADLGLDVRGFGDLTASEVARLAGLPLADAELASRRDFDEPFLWTPAPSRADVARLRAWLARRSLRLTLGGRFWHVVGGNDKGRAVRWLLARVRRSFGAGLPVLGIGDSENDLPMLRATGIGVLVARPGGGHLRPRGREDGLVRVAGVGPAGWADAVGAWLDTGFRAPTQDPSLARGPAQAWPARS